MNAAAATPIRSINKTQAAWLAKNGIETVKDSCLIGLGFYRAANEASLSFYGGSWGLEEADYCDDGDGARFVRSYSTLKEALKGLVAHKPTRCGCCH